MIELQGIDVSQYQGTINFNSVRSAGKHFVIIRAGYCGYDGIISKQYGYDTKYDENIVNAHNAGLDMGVYVYSYATSTSSAVTAANQVIDMVKGHEITYPIVFDFEDNQYTKNSKDTNTEICMAFLNEVEKLGYYAMLYTYTSFADNYLNMSKLRAYDLWIADYRGYVGYDGHYGIWQYSSSGSVPGISGRVDLNVAYQNYPSIIKNAGLNKLTSSTPAPTPTIRVGSEVRIKSTATTYATGQTIPGWVKEGSYFVKQIDTTKKRALLGAKNGPGINSWVYLDDLSV